jgi:curved DNA-binding protein
MARDLYQTLGVTKEASDDQIKKAFRKLAAQHHPDRNPGKANEEKFKEISAANDVLGDKDKRALYDEFGDMSLQQGFDPERARAMRDFGGGRGRGGPVSFEEIFGQNPGAGDMGDIFGGIFGGQRRGAGRQGPRRGQDLESTVTIDLASALRGTQLSLRVSDTGEPVTVRVPPGVSEGGRLRIQGQGGPGQRGGPPGDLLLVVHVSPHPHFKREGDDLWLDLPITVVEAYEGAKVRVPTIDGEVMLKVKPRTQSGDVSRLRGKGVASARKPPGDLYVKFLVKIPQGDDPAIEAAMKQLAEHLTDPRVELKL